MEDVSQTFLFSHFLYQETESSLRKVQLRMAEAEKRMMEDDIISDNMLLEGSAEFGGGEGLDFGGEFPRGGRVRGGHTKDALCQTTHPLCCCTDEPRVEGSMTGDGIATDDVSYF